ncbi:MAG TPA: SGNH/GDSL hydrolase family protein, partial [Sedimentisphaerales bacterium]|nr:SGNH/GDSL hydrolase family protein [Sedimentisphaerales bacterium]
MKEKYNIISALALILIINTIGPAQDISTDMQKRIMERSLVTMGDTTRIENVLTKAINKEPLVISVIGGSITEGAAASNYQNQYGSLVADWFKKNFPETPIKYVNAAIGASSSNMGTHRVEDNLLKHKPDLVVCEYAVNDGGNDLIPETMEGLVRQMLKAEKQPAVILLFMCGQNGKNEQEKHTTIGKHYNLP